MLANLAHALSRDMEPPALGLLFLPAFMVEIMNEGFLKKQPINDDGLAWRI